MNGDDARLQPADARMILALLNALDGRISELRADRNRDNDDRVRDNNEWRQCFDKIDQRLAAVEKIANDNARDDAASKDSKALWRTGYIAAGVAILSFLLNLCSSYYHPDFTRSLPPASQTQEPR